MKDYLAIILFATGSSHARGPDLDDCVKRVTRIFTSDWGSLFDVHGKELTVAIYDATGHDSIYWDHRGVFASQADGSEVELARVGLRKVTTPAKRGRR